MNLQLGWSGFCLEDIRKATVSILLVCMFLQAPNHCAASIRLAMETYHVPADRLRDLATDDDVTFTQTELDHVRECAECFGEWSTIMESFQPDLLQ